MVARLCRNSLSMNVHGASELILWQEVNVKGLHNTSVYWIRSQPNAKEPEGTFINVSSALAGFALPGTSSYASTKLAGHRYVECLGAGKPFSFPPRIS